MGFLTSGGKLSKVYVTNKGGHDYSAAKKYGTLVYCTEGTLPRYNTSQMFRQIARAMADSEEDDYILLTSLTTLNTVACGYFAHKHGRLNLLLFRPDRGKSVDGEYLERVILFGDGYEAHKGSDGEGDGAGEGAGFRA